MGETKVEAEETSEADYYYSDDEEDELEFKEPFDLASLLLEHPASAEPGATEDYCTAQILRVVRGRVVEARGILPDASPVSFSNELTCRMEEGNLTITAGSSLKGTIRKGGRTIDLAGTTASSSPPSYVLNQGDSARLVGNDSLYRIEVYRPPKAPRPGRLRARPAFLITIALAMAIHAALGMVNLAPLEDQPDEITKDEVFAVVTVDKPETQEPPKKKKMTPPPPAPPDSARIAEKAPDVSASTVSHNVAVLKGRPTTSTVDSLLHVLSKGSGTAGAGDSLKDLISNIDAVAPPGGSSGSPFKIAGAIGSLPGNEVNIARKGGGGVISTLSGDDVASKTSGLATLGQAKPGGTVRGSVTKMSSELKIQGSLERSEVTRVVNAAIHRIQACYERALISNPGLAGRIVFDWTVVPDGKVRGVRVRSSTLGSAQVADCISDLIKTWQFPQPEGGEVVITYPFLFRSL